MHFWVRPIKRHRWKILRRVVSHGECPQPRLSPARTPESRLERAQRRRMPQVQTLWVGEYQDQHQKPAPTHRPTNTKPNTAPAVEFDLEPKWLRILLLISCSAVWWLIE